MKLPNFSMISAGAVCGFAIRILAIIGAAGVSGSWWIAVPAIIVLDLIEGRGRNEVDRWQKTFWH